MKSGNSSGGDLEEIRVESLESGMSSSLDLSKEPVQPPKWYRHITGAPAAGWHDVRKFIKARKGQGRILMVLAILQYGILLLLAYLINISLFYKASGDHCAGGGDFSLFNNGYDWWTGADFFQITLSTGNFSFTLAKIVDSLWDVVSAQSFIPNFRAWCYRTVTDPFSSQNYRVLDEEDKLYSFGYHGTCSETMWPSR